MLKQVLYGQLTPPCVSLATEEGLSQEQAFRKLPAPVELPVLHMTLSHPGVYLHEIQTELLELLGVDVSIYLQVLKSSWIYQTEDEI